MPRCWHPHVLRTGVSIANLSVRLSSSCQSWDRLWLISLDEEALETRRCGLDDVTDELARGVLQAREHGGNRHLIGDGRPGERPYLARRLGAFEPADGDAGMKRRAEGEHRYKRDTEPGGDEALGCRVLIGLDGVLRPEAGLHAGGFDDELAVVRAGAD